MNFAFPKRYSLHSKIKQFAPFSARPNYTHITPRKNNYNYNYKQFVVNSTYFSQSTCDIISHSFLLASIIYASLNWKYHRNIRIKSERKNKNNRKF